MKLLRTAAFVVLLPASLVFAADTAVKDTRLVLALKAGDSAAASSLLTKRADPNVAEPDGTTPLHWAIRNDDSTLVDRLIKAGANVNAANRYGITPIALACENGSVTAVRRLLDAGVSANATGPYGETALMTCARTGKVDAARVLLTRGAKIDVVETWRGQTALLWATAQGHPQMMRLLIEAGADVGARTAVMNWERQRTLEPREKWLPLGGLTPLHYAAREGCVECAKVLLSNGADRNAVDADQMSPLVSALINGHYDVAGALIQGGADLALADRTGRTALYAAVDDHTMPQSNRPSPQETNDELSSIEVITMLVDHGAPVNAALRSQVPYRTKLDRGGDGVLGAGTTPLIRAAKSGDATVVKLLLEKGANPKAATNNGVNAIMIAANVGTREEDMTGRGKTQKLAIETIRLLLAAGADPNAADTQGRTALHGSATWGLTDVVRFLTENGAKLDARDKRGLTPLDAATGLAGGLGFDGRTGTVHDETAKLIREKGGVAGTPIEPAPSGRGAGAGRQQQGQDDNQ